ncbi:YhdH/YhfP family quinone oxidoreductase [Siphonobacter sp. SORGH_AS_0500]|uniref:YhdH/YhfP family quinone oxidoreductase n=1 Tax=Siphonobacter sp. SORGH_AS_0500 TaxID=1864824 RepID=UPI00285F9EF1|nr:YhdH/YhfP family quinone oxidoreductase [Siphonobacter sp. SORGH_AS_0500]MDR6197965.1 acrylyl-CoA reductase (NADPH) [Siphonobacter sp. SORGH_AS_0500]
MENTFKALLIREENGQFLKQVQQVPLSSLPDHDTLIRVTYSSLNYKDALSATGNKGVTRTFPHVPGIDAVGVVEESSGKLWKKGDQVLVTGFDLGMNTWGGYGQYIRVPGEWIVALPPNLQPQEAMALGTAGFTAGLCVDKLVQAGIKPSDGPIAVSGATGGVGSISLQLLSKLGYQTVGISGKKNTDLQQQLNGTEWLDRQEFTDESKRALLKPRFAGAIDTVGGSVLTTLVRSLQYNGVVAACGMAQSGDLNLTVFPFILNGVSLLGVDSVQASMPVRQRVWNLLANEWKPEQLVSFTKQLTLEELLEQIGQMLAGQTEGRTLVKLW